MNTEVKWAIRLARDRSAKHEVNIKILDFDTSKETIPTDISIIFASFQQVNSIIACTNGQEYNWKRRPGPGESKSYFCELSEIIAKYEDDPPENLEVHLAFEETNAVLQTGNYSIVNLHYDCIPLKSYSIDVDTHLPGISRISYADRWIRIKMLWWKKHTYIGVYRIDQMEGGKVQKWDSFVGGRFPIIKYRNPKDSSGFPPVAFGYELTGRPLTSLVLTYLAGMVTLIILPILLNLISSTAWVEKLFNNFSNYWLK